MRTSKSQQDLNRRQLIASAVELMSSQGFEATTMKQIARAAGLGDATIYKYFPSKEKLVLGYFELAWEDALASWRETPDLQDFGLQESLQWLMDCLLERLMADREFVQLARGLLQRAPLLMLGEQLPGKRLVRAEVLALLDQAEARGEIPPCPAKQAVAALMGDYSYAVLAYWLRDESEAFGDTTQLLDLSLSLAVLVLQSGLIGKLLELGGFLLRSSLARWMQDGAGLLDVLRIARDGLQGMAGRRT